MQRAWPLLAALLLAGCASDPAPAPARQEISFGDAPAPAGFALAPLEWRVLHRMDVAITPATPASGQLSVPPGTLQVIVNLTVSAGAAYGLALGLGDCSWRRDLAIVGDGRTYGADCGGVAEGDAALQVLTHAGALAGALEVAAIVCDGRLGRCPAPLPVTAE
ncbi:MAG TPA: hypothetical protein VM582_09845 [Candidatus Thermoplasmatota archaeon]|nr:hypothetical protein [Candidatus Thermoplasmatota archaeon]